MATNSQSNADEQIRILAGVRVLDLAPGMAAAYCGKLLVDAGADVVRVESEGGDPLRARRGGGIFAYLHAGKRSITGEWTALAAAADLLIVDRQVDVDALQAVNPGLTVLAITPFGLEGPWADHPANEFTLQAWCGSTGSRGYPDTPPLAAGGEVGEFITGTFAAVAAMAALFKARRGGQGSRIDVSQLECMALSYAYYPTVQAQFKGDRGFFDRWIDIPSIEPARDGHVALTTVTPAQFSAFLELIGREDLRADTDLANRISRQRRRKEFVPVIHANTTQRDMADLIEDATRLRIPVAPVCSAESVREIDHFHARGMWIDSADKRFVQPAGVFRIDGLRTRVAGPVSAPGADAGLIDWTPRPAVPAAATDARLPLEGLRVADCTAFWAGPVSSLLLAALGADVIHVEGPRHFDSNRNDSIRPRDEEGWWNVAGLFHAVNTGKRGIAVDLKQAEGADAFRALLMTCDVLIENNSPRVMDGFGLGWPVLHAANPRLVMTRMPGFGLDGPWRDRVAYAFTAEAVSGLAWSTGWQGSGPTVIGGPCDPLVAAHAAFATLLALHARETSGQGALVEACLVEPALAVSAIQSIEYQVAGIEPGRYGNRDPRAAPQGVYRCAPDDSWIAISVRSDAEWAALVSVITALGTVSGLGGHEARWARHDQIDAMIDAWAAALEPGAAVARLLAAGVPAAVVVRPQHLADNPQLAARHFFESVESASAGRYNTPVAPFRFAGVERWSRRPAPDLGEHNSEVFRAAGLEETAVADLKARGVLT